MSVHSKRRHRQLSNNLGPARQPGRFLRASLCQTSLFFHTAQRSTLKFLLNLSLSDIASGMQSEVKELGHWILTLLLWIPRTFWSGKQRLVRWFGRLRRAALLPITVEGPIHQLLVPQHGPGLRLPVWNLETSRRHNADSARCICWILRSITTLDPLTLPYAL